MELTKTKVYQLSDMTISLDGRSLGFVDGLTSEQRLALLESCRTGKFNPSDTAPYEEDIKNGSYTSYMKDLNNSFHQAKEGKIERIVFTHESNSLGSLTSETITFDEWTSLNRPKRITLRKVYEPTEKEV